MAMFEIAKFSPDAQWFAVWTRSRQEKIASSILSSLDVQHFLPLKTEIRQWSDRRQVVTVPLFTGYLFVRMNLTKESRIKVLNASGVVGFVGNQMGPAPIPDQQIEDIHRVLKTQTDCNVVPLLTRGDRVRVLRGPLVGVEGRLVRNNSSMRLSISIELIHKSLMVNVPREDVEVLEVNNVEPVLFHASQSVASTSLSEFD